MCIVPKPMKEINSLLHVFSMTDPKYKCLVENINVWEINLMTELV